MILSITSTRKGVRISSKLLPGPEPDYEIFARMVIDDIVSGEPTEDKDKAEEGVKKLD